MDHARHMSSPSPTSSFLFQHSERAFKTNVLNPSLLTSVGDVSDVDDCFSSSNANHLHGRLGDAFGDTDDAEHEHTILVSDDEHHVNQTDNLADHHHGHHHHHHHHHSHHNQQHQREQDEHCVVIDHDSLNGVDNEDEDEDDVEGMHNILSGSSASSTATMPLLTDGNSHNPFPRISLEEYSPLSLVDECDNALAQSPNSLACGPNHPFKTSLINLKMDNLDGVDVGDVHDDDVVGGHVRPMSPTLLSATSSALHHQQWSTSSTAITQNPSLLNSSASFLLSHQQHHHQQLNSLMQQLEPQSLDEPPPPLLVGGISSFDYNDHQNLMSHRPSSEPPPGCAFDIIGGANGNNINNLETKSMSSQSNASTIMLEQPPALKAKVAATNVGVNKSKANMDNVGLLPVTSSNRSSRRSRSHAASVSSAPSTSSTSTKQQQQINNLKTSEGSGGRNSSSKNGQTRAAPFSEQAHSSKVLLQLNHHQKLKELQQRLFGTAAASTSVSKEVLTVSISSKVATESKSSDKGQNSSQTSVSSCSSETKKLQAAKKEEADSSAASIKQTSTQTTSKGTNICTNNKVRVRTTSRRKSRGARSEANSNVSALASTLANPSKSMASKMVATETAEPDTTTTTSDCVKLADLLATTQSLETSTKNSNISMMLNNVFGADSNNVCNQNNNNNNDKARIQHIQLQVSPSMTVVTSGGLVQPISMQHQQMSNTRTVVCSGALDNQVLCRPITVMTPMNGCGAGNGTQIKCNTVMSNELARSADAAVFTSWSMPGSQQGSSGNGDGGTYNPIATNNTGVGAHQIAIQVICQDGTSLVLPVSSATALNGLSLTPQTHQQLQAILGSGNGIANQQQQQQARNLVPLVSVANIVAQQQQSTANEAGGGPCALASSLIQNGSGATNNATQTSGLAASSPTLAALLDAGSARMNNGYSFSSNSREGGGINMSSPQSIVSTNLLRKLIGNSQANLELKRGEIALQPGTQLGLTNNGSLVTVCTVASNGALNGSATFNGTDGKNTLSTCTNGEKRIKLESNPAELGSGNEGGQNTFALLENGGLVVANGNGAKLVQADDGQLELSQTKATSLGARTTESNNNNSNSTSGLTAMKQELNGSDTSNKSTIAALDANNTANKNCKMTSSTGNRQVDPTQPFRCEHCNSTFTRLGNFTRHKKIHTVPIKDGQRFKCDVCSKSFLQRCDLARHLHIHRGTEPHRCNICGKGYIRHSDLVTHQRFHNKEKPFGCPHCSKGFCQRGDLNRHLRSIHLQMKPILCPCCNRKFAKQETLLRHLNTAHRGRPGAPSSVISELATSNFAISSGDGKQANSISLATVVNGTSSTNTVVENNKTVASLQAIQATLCKVQRSADPSIAVKVEIPTTGGGAS